LSKVIETGDIFIIDTGCVYDSYFCDFDRNYAFGHATDKSKRAYEVVHKATDAGFEACQVGNTTTDIFHAMNKVMQDGGALGNSVGRLGHGLGMQLTELAIKYYKRQYSFRRGCSYNIFC